MNTDKTPHKYFASLLEIGKIVLGSTENDITTLFRPFEMSLIEYRFGKTTENMLELQLEGATLTCFFSESDVCKLSILYLEQLNHIARYIRYCDDSYEYDYSLNIWQTDDGYIRLKYSEETGNRIAFIQSLNRGHILKETIQ